MSSDNVNAAADDSFVFDPNASFGEEDSTEKPKYKKEEYKSTQQMSAWDPNFVNQQKKLQLQEAERLALMRAPLGSTNGKPNSATNMTNFESYWKSGKGGSKRKRNRSKSKTRSRKQKRSRKQSNKRRRSSRR